MAFVSYWLVEKPFLALKDKSFGQLFRSLWVSHPRDDPPSA